MLRVLELHCQIIPHVQSSSITKQSGHSVSFPFKARYFDFYKGILTLRWQEVLPGLENHFSELDKSNNIQIQELLVIDNMTLSIMAFPHLPVVLFIAFQLTASYINKILRFFNQRNTYLQKCTYVGWQKWAVRVGGVTVQNNVKQYGSCKNFLFF